MTTEGIVTVDTGPKKVSRRTTVTAPASELFAIVADPHRHHELDGSGTVVDNARGPDRLSKGAKFTTKMKMYGLPYKITSVVTEFDEDQLIEWRHPAGHRWRWEFAALTPDSTEVTETWDYSASALGGKPLELTKFPAKNAKGIRATLAKLRRRYAD